MNQTPGAIHSVGADIESQLIRIADSQEAIHKELKQLNNHMSYLGCLECLDDIADDLKIILGRKTTL